MTFNFDNWPGSIHDTSAGHGQSSCEVGEFSYALKRIRFQFVLQDTKSLERNIFIISILKKSYERYT